MSKRNNYDSGYVTAEWMAKRKAYTFDPKEKTAICPECGLSFVTQTRTRPGVQVRCSAACRKARTKALVEKHRRKA